MIDNNIKIGIIGLGYVGLPLAVEFGKKYATVGFDIQQTRVKELNSYLDNTLEVDNSELKKVVIDNLREKKGLFCSYKKKDLKDCNVFIVTVPTPTDKHNKPVLIPLIKASETIGAVLKKQDIVIYESTVYPGATEEECVPVLEKVSGLKFNQDFFVGYSPERINPGDKTHTVTKIRKVTSGSNEETATKVDNLYKSIIVAGTFKAASIKVAEAAKVIENAQRDINIAFVNELSKIFNHLDIDTSEVLEAAKSKWNFLPFTPGLVGGHCIGVDPYYLAQKAQEVGYHPEIILAGRRLNDTMGAYVATQVVKHMVKKSIDVAKSKTLILGITFKENCPDIRNSKVLDVISELATYDTSIDVYDPWANKEEVINEYGISIFTSKDQIKLNKYDCVILAVSHKEFLKLDIKSFTKPTNVIYDIKSFLPKTLVDARL